MFDDEEERTEFVGRANTVGFVNGAFFLIAFICFIVAFATFYTLDFLTAFYPLFAVLYSAACGLTFYIAARVKKLELKTPLKTDRGIEKAHQYFVSIGSMAIGSTSIGGIILCAGTFLWNYIWRSFINDMKKYDGNTNILEDFFDFEDSIANNISRILTTPGYDRNSDQDMIGMTTVEPEDEAYEIHSLYIFLLIHCILNIAVVMGVNNFFFLKHMASMMKVPIPIVAASNITQAAGSVNQPMISTQQTSTVGQPQVVIPGKPQTTVAGAQPSPVVYQQPAVQYVPPQQQPGTYYPVQAGAQPGTFYPVQQGAGYYPMQQVQQPVMYVQPQAQVQLPNYQPSAVVPPIQYDNDQPNTEAAPPPPNPDSNSKQ